MKALSRELEKRIREILEDPDIRILSIQEQGILIDKTPLGAEWETHETTGNYATIILWHKSD